LGYPAFAERRRRGVEEKRRKGEKEKTRDTLCLDSFSPPLLFSSTLFKWRAWDSNPHCRSVNGSAET
jgi:hypothetical protein